MNSRITSDVSEPLRETGTDTAASGSISGDDVSLDERDLLLAIFQEGDYGALESRLCTLVQEYPQSGFAWMLLGTALHMQGKDGLPALQKSVALLPDDVNALMNFGSVLMDLNRLEEAETCFRRALQSCPDNGYAYYNLGNMLLRARRLDEAEPVFRTAVQFNPDHADAHNNLGNTLWQLGKLHEAEESYFQALQSDPYHPDAHYNRTNTLRELGRLEEAEASSRWALLHNPNSAEDHCNAGNVLQALGRLHEAEACYRKSIGINPDYADAHNNLGRVLNDLRRWDEAEECYRRALQIAPDHADAHSNLGVTLKELGRLKEAEASYLRALQLRPDHAEAYSNLLFAYNYAAERDASHCLEEARRYGRMTRKKATAQFGTWSCSRQPERLRIGLVSGNLGNHPVGYFLENLLPQFDPTRIELLAYLTDYRTDNLTARIKPYFSEWKSLIGLADGRAAELIRNDGIHLLLDLDGHTAPNRLPIFAWKPAPVAASWLGYFATTGVDEIDYLIADKVGIPESQRSNFSERIWYLPDTRLCFTPPLTNLAVAALPALANGFVTFGCFQNLTKVGDEVLAVWGRILAALPGARLRWQCKQLGDPVVAERFMQRLQQHGISPNRVAIFGKMPREAYLAAHAEVDLILDTFPYPGGTTTCEALWMGVPTLTLAGDSLLSRQGASLLTAAGLSQYVATNQADYMEKALLLANDIQGLAALRFNLRIQLLGSPLFDATRFTRHLQDALWEMWKIWVGQNP